MRNLQQVLQGIIVALASIGLILGGFSLSLTEGNMTSTLAPGHTLVTTYPATSQSIMPSTNSPAFPLTSTPTQLPTLTSNLTSTLTPTLPLLPTNCTPPADWLPYVVQSGDTLEKIATLNQVSPLELQQANCLQVTSGLVPGKVLYVPPVPTQTVVSVPSHTPVACSHPRNWVVYYVQRGDTLYRLSLAYGVSVGELQRANCMGNSILLQVGQPFYVPYLPVRTPLPTIPVIIPTTLLTNTPTSLPSDTPVGVTDTPFLPTETPLPPTDTPFPPTDTPFLPTDTTTSP
jgi:LysM repeat protein